MITRTPAALDATFRDLVAHDVRGNLSAEQSAELRKPENLERWYDALVAIKMEVEVQLANRQARWHKKQAECMTKGERGRLEWINFRASEADWRVRAIRFLTSIEEHLAACKEIKRSLHGHQREVSAEERLSRVYDAIMAHREGIEEEEATDADKRLWSVINS